MGLKYWSLVCYEPKFRVPQLMFRLILFFVASLVRKSFSIEIVDMLSDLKEASPFLEIYNNVYYKLKGIF
jgi:hypothetical protein